MKRINHPVFTTIFMVFTMIVFMNLVFAQPKKEEEDLTMFKGFPIDVYKRCAAKPIDGTCPEKITEDKTYKLSANKLYLERKADGKTYYTCQKPVEGKSDDKPCSEGNCSCRLFELNKKAAKADKKWKQAPDFNAAYYATHLPKKDHDYACICRQNP